MEGSNQTFDKVLQKAQKLGYAEPGNPKLDLNGFDAFAKIRILSALSFNTKILTPIHKHTPLLTSKMPMSRQAQR